MYNVIGGIAFLNSENTILEEITKDKLTSNGVAVTSYTDESLSEQRSSNEAILNRGVKQVKKPYSLLNNFSINSNTGKDSVTTKQNMKGKRHSEKTKQQMSYSHLGKRHSEETKQKMSVAHLGKRHSEETKQKMSEVHQKRWRKWKTFINSDTLRDAKNNTTELSSQPNGLIIKDGSSEVENVPLDLRVVKVYPNCTY